MIHHRERAAPPSQTKSYIASMKCRAQRKRSEASVAARRATECRPTTGAAVSIDESRDYSRDRLSHEVPSAAKAEQSERRSAQSH